MDSLIQFYNILGMPGAVVLVTAMFVAWCVYLWAKNCWGGSPGKGRKVRRVALIAALILTVLSLPILYMFLGLLAI